MKIKTLINIKENKYLLNCKENYKKELSENIGLITKKYYELLCEYIKFIIENISIKHLVFSKFIIIRGLDTITNVFNNILYYTKNIELAYFHCQKSFYFYLEFVGQISEDDKKFLLLTSRDATIYVYKKTIFEINNDLKKTNESISESTKEKFNLINTYINLYQTYLLKVIHFENIGDKNIVDKTIIIFAELCNKLSHYNANNINMLYNITEKIYYKIPDIILFFEFNNILVDKFIENPKSIDSFERKIYMDEFEEKIIESNEKFKEWFFSNNY